MTKSILLTWSSVCFCILNGFFNSALALDPPPKHNTSFNTYTLNADLKPTVAALIPENVVWLVPIRSLLNRLTLLILIHPVMTEQPNKSKPGGSVIPVITKAVILVMISLYSLY